MKTIYSRLAEPSKEEAAQEDLTELTKALAKGDLLSRLLEHELRRNLRAAKKK